MTAPLGRETRYLLDLLLSLVPLALIAYAVVEQSSDRCLPLGVAVCSRYAHHHSWLEPVMWSNRETRMLYEHLSRPNTFVVKLVGDALDDVRSEPDLWSDFERQAVRALATSLRAHVEGIFEDFYFGPESKRTPQIARMCSDVGSIWRVNWSEVAKQLFEGGGHTLEPP